jgi:hypothetical protein
MLRARRVFGTTRVVDEIVKCQQGVTGLTACSLLPPPRRFVHRGVEEQSVGGCEIQEGEVLLQNFSDASDLVRGTENEGEEREGADSFDRLAVVGPAGSREIIQQRVKRVRDAWHAHERRPLRIEVKIVGR